jgi:hypothetical protein
MSQSNIDTTQRSVDIAAVPLSTAQQEQSAGTVEAV